MSKKTTSEKSQSAPVAGNEAAGAESAAPAPAAPPPSAAPTPDASVDYKAMYEQANDRWLRARADMDNYRKRVQREIGEIRAHTVIQTVQEFLGVHDQLSMALAHTRSAGDSQVIRQGLELIHAEFGRVLSTLGVARLEVAGKTFDPALHEAISEESSEEFPAGTVMRELKAGFVLGERLLRPASVTVSSGTAAVATDTAAS